MVPRTDFHCITTKGCMFFWVKFCNAFVYFVVSGHYPDARCYYQWGLLISKEYQIARPNCAFADLKYIFTQENFNLNVQGKLNINEQDTSFLDCKHKHMMKSGAPHDKFLVLHCLFPIEFHDFPSKIDF